MKNIVLFGPPGAGKGTQAEFIKKEFSLYHISTGDLFRYHIKNQTDLGKKVSAILESGKLVSDDITISMLKREVEQNLDKKGFIFDGFPRTTDQATSLDKMMENLKIEINTVLSLEVPDEELIKRLLKRGETSGRPDDANESIIKQRIATYMQETNPVKEFYNNQGKLKAIDGVGSIDYIKDQLLSEIKSI